VVNPAKTTVLIVDDHQLVVDGLRAVLGRRDEYEVTGEALDGSAAVAQAESLKPDLMILDVSMPGMSGIEAASRIRSVSPSTRVLMYSMNANPQTVLALLQAGVSGYVLKEEPLETLLSAISEICAGKTYCSRGITEMINPPMES
jgi:DNA-binding NarL/FixJ family response regulator